MSWIKSIKLLKSLRKSARYSRLRQYFPMAEPRYIDDRPLSDAEVVKMDWPAGVKRPQIGIVKDFEVFPRWTKYCRFLENNAFEYDFYNIHAHDWIEKAKSFDIVIGIWSCEWDALEELRSKYYFLERYLGKSTYPSTEHALLYEDKKLEAYLAAVAGIPFVKTYISQDKQDALQLLQKLEYPAVSKIVPGSGSLGVELVRNQEQACKIVTQAFSRNGRKAHFNFFRQKQYVYFQELLPNDGYDLRAIVVNNWVFGYYRKVAEKDFRASGMGYVEKRALPPEAMKIALRLNDFVRSPMLVVDMLHGTKDDQYYIIEYSPVCQMEFPEQLHVDGVPGVYVADQAGNFHFQKGKYWVHELALREFLSQYLNRAKPGRHQ